MRRLTMPLLLGITVVSFHAVRLLPHFTDDPAPHMTAYTWAEMRVIFDQERELDQTQLRHRAFREDFAGALREVAGRRLPLDDARRQVLDSARRDNPDLIRYLRRRHPDLDDGSLVLLMLAQHLDGPRSGAAAPRAFDDLLCELEIISPQVTTRLHRERAER